MVENIDESELGKFCQVKIDECQCAQLIVILIVMFTALACRFISYMYLQLYIARKSYAHAFARDTPILPASFLEK